MSADMNAILSKLQTYALTHGLAFRNIIDGGQEKYSEYIKNEFDIDHIYNHAPIIQEPQSFTVEIKKEKKRFIFQTFMVDNGYGPSTQIIVFANSQSDINLLLQYLENKYNPKKSKMFCWDTQYGRYMNSNYEISPAMKSHLVGLDSFFGIMKKEIDAIQNHSELAIELGASGVNYLVYGPPGTGKTTFFKVMANESNQPIYSVNLSLVPKNQYKFALSPQVVKNPSEYDSGDEDIEDADENRKKKNNSGVIYVLIEDFDRYIKDDKGNMSELLNALDGIHNSHNVIRIFSANMPELALKDSALKSRIKRFIKFDLPTDDNIYQHLVNVSRGDTENAKKLADLMKGKNLSYRTINNYLSRFITDDSLLGAAVAEFDKWMEENAEIQKLVSQVTK